MLRKISILWLFCLILCAKSINAQELLAEISEHIIRIQTDFRGATLTMFGSIDRPLTINDNLIIKIRGPRQNIVLRRKEKQGFIWMNKSNARFESIPAFYRLFSVIDPEQNTPSFFRSGNQIGIENIRLNAEGDDIVQMKNVLRREMFENNAYQTQTGDINLLNSSDGHSLFYLTVEFPQTVPVGSYMIETFLSRNNNIVSAQTTPLLIFKDGIGADVALFAQRYSLWYGIIAVAIAVFFGWLAAKLFGKKV